MSIMYRAHRRQKSILAVFQVDCVLRSGEGVMRTIRGHDTVIKHRNRRPLTRMICRALTYAHSS
jgi:hypothetical protein